ncbi:MAG: helix-turn-helix domain-containing protein [Terriglobia bacterium]
MTQWIVGQQLRAIRDGHKLTLKQVEGQSRLIAEQCNKPDELLTAGRLSQVETSNSRPSLYKLASLSAIYRMSYLDLLRVYGIEAGQNGIPASNGNGHDARTTGDEQPVPTAYF